MSLLEAKKEIFSRLDPLLRLLLASIEHLDVETKNHHHHHNANASTASTGDALCAAEMTMKEKEDNQQKIIILLQTQVRLLQQLRNAMSTTVSSSALITKTLRSQDQSQEMYNSPESLPTLPSPSTSSAPSSKNFKRRKEHRDDKNKFQHRKALSSMAEYVFLPLIIILQSTTQSQQHYEHTHHDLKGSIEFRMVHQSATLNSISEAARTLSLYVSIIHNYQWNDLGEDGIISAAKDGYYNYTLDGETGANDDDSNDEDDRVGGITDTNHNNDVTVEATVLGAALRLKCVTACAMALASISIIDDNNHQTSQKQPTPPSASQNPEVDEANNYHRSAIYGNADSDKRLENGEDCTQSLLQCVQTLCSRPQLRTCYISKQEHQKVKLPETPLLKVEAEFTHQMVQAMGGGNLIARLIQSCLSCFGLHSPPLTNNPLRTSICGSGPSRNFHNHSDIKGNVSLKLQALWTLQSILSLPCGVDESGASSRDYKAGGMVSIIRSLLPGCFAGLYKQAHTHLRLPTSISSPKIAIESIKTLVLLLNMSLSIRNHQKNDNTKNKMQDSSPSILVTDDREKEQGQSSSDFAQAAFIKLAAVASSSLMNDTTQIVSEEISPELMLFVNHVNGKLPTPLLVLFNLIPSHKSAKVRKAGVEFLCKCVLVDTYLVWDKNDNVDADVLGIGKKERQHQEVANGNNLVDGALECLLTMLGDNECTSISTECQNIMQMHRLKIGATMWKEEMRYSIIPRTLSLIESLPVLAKSGREIELQANMKLITGYLYISYNQNCLDKTEIKFLASKILENPIRQSLADIFALDNNTIGSAVKVVHNLKDDANMTPSFNISSNFCNMKGQSPLIAKRMIQSISHILTPKQIALFVDACIAQIFDDLCEKTRARCSLCDKRHTEWIHRHTGLIIVANEILNSQSVAMKRRSKVTTALARSILPIIFSDPLWHLPTSLELAKVANQGRTDKDILDIYFRKTRRYPETLSNEVIQRGGNATAFTIPKLSVSALNGNSTLTAHLMELVGTISFILQRGFDIFLPTILYPLLQKTSDINGDYVQQTTFAVLSRISTDLGYSSTRAMLSFSCNLLMETITCELLCPSHIESNSQHHHMAICFHVIEMTMQNLHHDTTTAVQHDSLDIIPHKRAINDETHIVMLVEMLDAMIFWFNHNSKKGHKELLSTIMIPLSLVKAFTASAKYINELMMITKRQPTNMPNENAQNCDYSEPWTDLLLQFKKESNCPIDVICDTDVSGKEAFIAHHCNKEYPKEVHTNKEIIPKDKTIKLQCSQSHDTLERVANVTRHMLSLSSFYLSSTDLKIQRTSCDMLLNGFNLLSSVECLSKAMGDDSDIGNPLLESVHKFWAPLRARLRSSGSAIISTSLQQSKNLSSKPFTGRHSCILFSKVLDITSTLCELSGGSMVDCFQKDVWPVIAETICHFLQTEFSEDIQNRALMKQTGNGACDRIHHSVVVSWEHQALLSCLQCIQRVFSGQEIGLLLSQLVPTVGAILMPILSDNGIIGDAAMDAAKALLSIDSDSLWRGLLLASGLGLSGRPLYLLVANNGLTNSQESKIETALENRSKHLLNYARSLPEQPLF